MDHYKDDTTKDLTRHQVYDNLADLAEQMGVDRGK